MMLSSNLLSSLVWMPIGFGFLHIIFNSYRLSESLAKIFSLAFNIPLIYLGILLYQQFDSNNPAFQLTERFTWMPFLNADYYLGVDGISMPLILLTLLLTPAALLAGFNSSKGKYSNYAGMLFLLEGMMIGVFLSLDALLFYFFWEALLIPMFLIIGIWGGPQRIYATLKFFLYTFFGSIFMLIALIYLYFQSGSYAIESFYGLPLTESSQFWIFLAFFIAFAIKIPMWPVHTWLPDAHVEAPTGGSVILAAVLLKMGGYGFLRFSLPIVPQASADLSMVVIVLSLIAITYIAFVALVQSDVKKLIAYSSIAHMGFVTLGIFSIFHIDSFDLSLLAMQGGMFQMISHGLISGAMFFAIGVLYDRLHSRNIADFGGIINAMPKFAALFVFFGFANIGLPGTSGFVGEFFVILATFAVHPLVSILAGTTLVFGASYTLWMIKRSIWGEPSSIRIENLKPMDLRESLVLIFLAIGVLALGIWPGMLTDLTSASLTELILRLGL
jgi:NADH-quinone oxidoreductase subunit M